MVEQPRRQSVMGVRLTPAGAHALLARPLCEVAGLVVDLRNLVGHAGEELADHLQDAPSVESGSGNVISGNVNCHGAYSRPLRVGAPPRF